MAKAKKVFICSNCGTTSPKWLGKCFSCGEWNTYQEEIIAKENEREVRKHNWTAKTRTAPQPTLLSEIRTGKTVRLVTTDGELNRVLGGGIVPGSMVLIGGQPGIGKSTLLLQVILRLNERVLYVSGEESEEQIKMRAERLGGAGPNCYILT